MRLTETITLLEVIWTAIAFIGFLYMIRLFKRAVDDRTWLLESGVNGDIKTRKEIALTSILIFVGGLVTQISYLTVGCLAMTQKSNGGGHPTAASIAISIIFITASSISTIFATIIYKRRMKVVNHVIHDYVRRDHKGE